MLNNNFNVGPLPGPIIKPDPTTPADHKRLLRDRMSGNNGPFINPSPLFNATQNTPAAMTEGGGNGALPAALARSGPVDLAPVGAALAKTRIGRNVVATTAPDAAAPGQTDNIGQANLKALDNLGSPLANGVRRYNMDPGNEAQVYVTRGKDGSTVFTDNAKYAAANSAGGLRRGDVRPDVLARTQGDRNGFEYAKSSLAQKGLDRSQFSALTPAQAHDAYLTAVDGSTAKTDQGLSDRNDANLLRSRFQDAGGAGGGSVGGLSDAAIAKLPPAQQIAAISARTRETQGNARLTIAQQQLEVARDSAQRQQAAEDRGAQRDVFNQYQTLKAKDPGAAENYLFNQIPSDPQEFDKFSATPAGRNVLNTYLTDVLQPQMANSLYPTEWGDARQVPKEGYSNLALGANGEFQGFNNPDGSGNQYPATTAVTGAQNYVSANRFSPTILRRLKSLGVGQ